jgi:hypothetical protein
MDRVLIFLGIVLINSIGTSQTEMPPSISVCAPSISQDYSIKCDLDCTDEPLTTVLTKLSDRYGIDCAPSIDTMDIQISLKENKDSDEWVMILATKYRVDCHIEYSEDYHPERLGLMGSHESITAMINELKTKYPFIQVIKDKGVHVDFKARQMPAWELFGKLAQEAGTGIDYMTSGIMRLTRNGRTVLSFGTFELFYVYLSKENVSGKIVIDFLHSPSSMTNLDDVKIENVEILNGSKQFPIKGHNITAQSSVRPFGGFEWVSDLAINSQEGTLKGTVSAWVLSGTYCVKNLCMNSQLKDFGLNILVSKAD